jgi:hypothetical protein
MYGDAELWKALNVRGGLENIILKYDSHTGYQKGFGFAVYCS